MKKLLLLVFIATGSSANAVPASQCESSFTSVTRKSLDAFAEARNIVAAIQGNSSYSFTPEARLALVRGGLASRRPLASLFKFKNDVESLSFSGRDFIPEVRRAVIAGALAGHRSPGAAANFFFSFSNGLRSSLVFEYRAAVIEGALAGRRSANEAVQLEIDAQALVPSGATTELRSAIVGGVLAGPRGLDQAKTFLREFLPLLPGNLMGEYRLAYIRGALAGNRTPEEAISLARRVRFDGIYDADYGAAIVQGVLSRRD